MKRVGAFGVVLLAVLLVSGCSPDGASTSAVEPPPTAQRTLGQIDEGPLDDDELITAVHLIAPGTVDVDDKEILRTMRLTCRKMSEGITFADLRSTWEGTGVPASTVEDMHTAAWLGAHTYCPEHIAEIEAG